MDTRQVATTDWAAEWENLRGTIDTMIAQNDPDKSPTSREYGATLTAIRRKLSFSFIGFHRTSWLGLAAWIEDEDNQVRSQHNNPRLAGQDAAYLHVRQAMYERDPSLGRF